jgi:hypothetical protein
MIIIGFIDFNIIYNINRLINIEVFFFHKRIMYVIGRNAKIIINFTFPINLFSFFYTYTYPFF